MATIKDYRKQKEKEKVAYNYFTRQGYSPEASAGIVGNLVYESRLNTSAEGDIGYKGGSSFGIAQFRGDRLSNLKKRYGNSWKDFNNQLDFVRHELETTHSKAGNILKNTRDVYEAGQAFSDLYEVPAKKYKNNKDRQNKVNGIYSSLVGGYLTPIADEEIRKANEYFQYQPTTDVKDLPISENSTILADNLEEKDKDIEEVQQQTKEYNFLQEYQNLISQQEQPQQVEQPVVQEQVPQQNLEDIYNQVSEFVDTPIAQQGLSYIDKLKLETQQRQSPLRQREGVKESTNTIKPNIQYTQKELQNIEKYARKYSISTKDASERLYNANQQAQNNQVKTYTPQTTKSRIWEVATHPVTAAGYAVRNEQLPENFSRGEINPHEQAVDIINPFFYADQAGKFVSNVGEGNFTEAGMNALNILPIATEYRSIGRLGKAINTEEKVLNGTLRSDVKSMVDAIDPRNLKAENGKKWLQNWYDNAEIKNRANSFNVGQTSQDYPYSLDIINPGGMKVDYAKRALNEHVDKNYIDLFKERGVSEALPLYGRSTGVSYGTPKGIYVKTQPHFLFNKSARESTKVHELTHLAEANGQTFNAAEKDILLEPFGYNTEKLYATNKTPLEILGSRSKTYYVDPTEIHARMNEARYRLGKSPEEIFTGKDFNKIQKDYNWFGMGKYIEDPKSFIKLMNNFYVTAPVAGTSYLATQQIQQENSPQFQQGGKTVIKDQEGQRKYPNQVTEIQGNSMSTSGYGDIPLYVVPDVGEPQIIQANTGNYSFPNATKFTEYPLTNNEQKFLKYIAKIR